MFPSGTVGAALLLFRISVTASLLLDGTLRGTLVTSIWVAAVFAVPALALCLGFLTPYVCGLVCLGEIGVLWFTGTPNGLHLEISIVNSALLAVLGPGAYSIDARVFGRRLITLSPRSGPPLH
jgi:hypothetical protein